MLRSITKAAHTIAAAVTAIVIAGQWFRRQSPGGMQRYCSSPNLCPEDLTSIRTAGCASFARLTMLARRAFRRQADAPRVSYDHQTSRLKAIWETPGELNPVFQT